MAKTKPSDALCAELRAFGLKYPGAHSKSPWPGHDDLAVNDKTFAYLSAKGEPFSISCKLPHSGTAALSLPYTEPAGYGLGKSGWVNAKFPDDHLPPISLLKEWIDESYRAQAPKRLVASLAVGSVERAAAARTGRGAAAPAARGAKSDAASKGKKPTAKTPKRAAATTTKRKSAGGRTAKSRSGR